jgi:hypothetical protein
MRFKLLAVIVALPLLASSAVFAQADVSGARRSVPEAEPSPNGYLTRVDSDSDDIVKLENGAIVEITSGYLGYVGYRKKAILYRTASGCKIWIEGKRVYRCDQLREPTVARKVVVEELSIASITDDGDVLKATDGRVFEVSSLYTMYTTLWLAPFEALLIGDAEIVNLDGHDEPVAVARLR